MTAQKSNISALTKEQIMSEHQWYIPTLVPVIKDLPLFQTYVDEYKGEDHPWGRSRQSAVSYGRTYTLWAEA